MARVFSAVLSFLQPGLGQLYQKEFLKSVFFFSAYATILFTPRALILIPLIVLVSSGDIYFLSKIHETSRNPGREWLFATAGFLGFLSWVNLLYGL
jgi:hypothetical protein